MDEARPDTVAWILERPWLAAGIAAWFVAWPAWEFLYYRSAGRTWDVEETKRSLWTAAIVGVWQVVVSLALTPLLWWAYPYRFATWGMDRWWHWALAWVLVDLAYYWIHRMLHSTLSAGRRMRRTTASGA